MKYQLFQPHPALKDFVHGILIAHADLRHLPVDIVCPFPPTPEQYLYFYLNDPIHTQKSDSDSFIRKSSSIIVGPQTQRVNLYMGKEHLMLAIIFRPGGLFRLTGVPMRELLDEDQESQSVLGNAINAVYDELHEAMSWTAMKDIAESFLLQQLPAIKVIRPFDHAIDALMKSGGLLAIEKAASLSCLSLRQFERQCLERIGLSPKFFARLARFSNAYRMKEINPDHTWTTIAHSAGYFDQMHMVRDFKQFAGVNPSLIEAELAATPLRLQAVSR